MSATWRWRHSPSIPCDSRSARDGRTASWIAFSRLEKRGCIRPSTPSRCHSTHSLQWIRHHLLSHSPLWTRCRCNCHLTTRSNTRPNHWTSSRCPPNSRTRLPQCYSAGPRDAATGSVRSIPHPTPAPQHLGPAECPACPASPSTSPCTGSDDNSPYPR